MRDIQILLYLGLIAAFINLTISYVKRWEILWVFTAAACLLAVMAFVAGILFTGSGFLTSLTIFASLLSILGMTVAALVVSAIQAIAFRKG